MNIKYDKKLDNILMMKPDIIVHYLKGLTKDECIYMYKSATSMYNNLKMLYNLGVSQVKALPEEGEMINSELFIVAASMQKLEDTISIIRELYPKDVEW